MNINREKFLNSLSMVRAGLSAREFIEQSSCLVFQGGRILTFNDEIACSIDSPVDITGAVQASSLISILEKLDDEELDVESSPDAELVFRGKRKSFGIVLQAEIFLPVDRVEQPKKWLSLPAEFTEALGLVKHCASTDQSRFLLTCVHITPSYVEACDNHQAMRCFAETGLEESTLVRSSSLEAMLSLGMDKIALTQNWLHFRNEAGLVYSCRRYAEDYPKLKGILNVTGHPVMIPKGAAAASDRATVFASDKTGEPLVMVTLTPGKMRIEGSGVSGWYRERRKTTYNGPDMEFLIAPNLLRHISERYNEAVIGEGKLKVIGGQWEYITVLGSPDEQAANEEPEAERKGKSKQTKGQAD